MNMFSKDRHNFRSAEHREQICSAVHSRLESLLELPIDRLTILPETMTVPSDIEGETVQFKVERELQPDGSILITVRADQPARFIRVAAGTTEGFLITPDGEKLTLPESLLDDYLD